jgi:hypothetical protein
MSYALIQRLECDDGSHPFSSLGQAQSARVGNVGPTGRCGAIVDQYEVRCPEKTYEIFIDMYHCGPGEEVF